MTHQNYPDDGTMHSHGGYMGMSTPEFVDVAAGRGEQPGLVTLYWSSQSCFDEMAKAMERLRIILAGWDFDPHVHSVTFTRTLGELAPHMMHGLPFLSNGAEHTLSSLQIDIIYRELKVSRRYRGFATATPVKLEDGRKSYTLTLERIVDPRPGADFIEVSDNLGVAAHHGVKSNLRYSMTPGKDDPYPASTEKQVWDVCKTILSHMNAQLTNVTFA